MTEVARIAAQEARELARSGRALLVCAYEDPARCAGLWLEGAISMQEFRARRGGLPRDQIIIFYCA